MSKITVNALGEPCPIPVVKAKKALGAMGEPGILEVLVDNEIAVQNVLRLASGSGLPAKSEKKGEASFVITIEVQTVPQGQPVQEPLAVCQPDQRGDTVVAIGSAVMGTGDEKLGRLLMKGFLYALSQQDKLPKTILFYNGGATIPIGGSEAVEDLKSMEAQGVEIHTCGTCLDFYGLTDKLAVGDISNMYDIVEMLTTAAKVVKP